MEKTKKRKGQGGQKGRVTGRQNVEKGKREKRGIGYRIIRKNGQKDKRTKEKKAIELKENKGKRTKMQKGKIRKGKRTKGHNDTTTNR